MEKKTLKKRIAELKGKGIFKKGVTTVAVVLSLAAAVFGMAGCTKNQTYEEKYGEDVTQEDLYFSKIFDGAIIVNEGGKYVLHRGELDSLRRNYLNSATSYTTPRLKLDCGETIYTSQFIAYKGNVKEGTYDEVCDCARDLVKPNKKSSNDEACECAHASIK